jgi:pimeloyl-ACP methyl ester carboxylesterase
VPKRAYITLTVDQLRRMLEHVPASWRPLFVCGPALGLRKGELFALRKADVDAERWTLTVARSHERSTTKSGVAAVLPIPDALRPWIAHQLEHAPGPLLFPAPDGSQRPREADPQKILRTALARAGITAGFEHRCRWCGHKEQHQDNEQRYCPQCVKRTDGRGHPLKQPRGRALWPKALQLSMRFHDLRHTTATLLLRAGVDAHRVQRLLRHRDVRTTTGIYGHLDVEDLRAALGDEQIDLLGFSHGGLVAAAYAVSHPARVRRLVLVVALAAFTPEMQAEAEREIAARAGEPWHAAAAAAIAREEGDYGSDEEAARMWNDMAPLYFARWEERYRPLVEVARMNPEPLRQFNGTPFDLRPELGRISAPTLVLTGRNDFICGPAAAQVLADGIPDSELVVLEDAGHMVHLEQPETFRQAVEGFLSR